MPTLLLTGVVALAVLLAGADRLATGHRTTDAASADDARSGARPAAGAGGLHKRLRRAPTLSRRSTLVDARLPAVPAGSTAPVAVRRTGALIERRTVLRARPGRGSRRVAVLGLKTRFGSRQLVTVVARRPGWVGVLHHAMPNGRAGWIPLSAVRVVQSRWELEVDRSERVVRARYDGRFVAVFPVSVGRGASPTPVARYGVTDRIVTSGGSPYGCCILAISGRQDDLPQGWAGGDRLALHGSPSDTVGQAASSGCLRLRERDLRWLMRRIPVGTRVDVVR